MRQAETNGYGGKRMNSIISLFEASVISFKNKAAVAGPVTGVALTYGALLRLGFFD